MQKASLDWVYIHFIFPLKTVSNFLVDYVRSSSVFPENKMTCFTQYVELITDVFSAGICLILMQSS
jgi:hypothetical protein